MQGDSLKIELLFDLHIHIWIGIGEEASYELTSFSLKSQINKKKQ